MATFLRGTMILPELTNLIDSSQDQVILVSPYLVLQKNIQDMVKDKSRKIPFTFVLGKEDDIDGETRNFLRGLKEAKLYSQEDLHATCYLNEDKAIFTSMNLSDFSFKNRYDMGVLIDRDYDAELFWDLCREVDHIIKRSTEIDLAGSAQEVTRPSEKEREGTKTPLPPDQGFCIRCGTTIPYDREKPFCLSCFLEWDSQGGNPYYEHQFCHRCRSPIPSSYEKPLCTPCSQKRRR